MPASSGPGVRATYNIVRVMSLQALADIASWAEAIRSQVLPLLGKYARQGSSSLKSRSTKLLRELLRRA